MIQMKTLLNVADNARKAMSNAGGASRPAPHSATPIVSSVVATGRAMNGAEMFMADCRAAARRAKTGRASAGRK